MVFLACYEELWVSTDVLCWPPWYEEKAKLTYISCSSTWTILSLPVIYIAIPHKVVCKMDTIVWKKNNLTISNVTPTTLWLWIFHFGLSSCLSTNLLLGSNGAADKSFCWCRNIFKYLPKVQSWITPCISNAYCPK